MADHTSTRATRFLASDRFTFEEGKNHVSLEPLMNRLMIGDFNDPEWCRRMYEILSVCSPGPFTVSHGDPRFDAEPIVVVTNPAMEVLAKCGPVRDSRSCFDAILFAAAANAIRRLVNERMMAPTKEAPLS